MKFWIIIACATLALGAAACTSDNNNTSADAAPDASAPDGGAGDAPTGGPGGAQPGGGFKYSACADPAAVIQFPTPAWETPGPSASGVWLKPPANDAAAALLRKVRRSWFDRFNAVDGVSLNGAFFVALEGPGGTAAPEKIRFFAWDGAKLEDMKLRISTAPSDDRKTLVIRHEQFPAPKKGMKYLLVIESGAVEQTRALPACNPGSGDPHPAYVDGAALALRNVAKDNLEYAMLFTPSRASVELPSLYNRLENAPVLKVEKVEKLDIATLDKKFAPPEPGKDLLGPAFRGIFDLPAYQNDKKVFEGDPETNLPVEKGRTRPGFVVALPKNANGPAPVVIFQHGGGRFKEDLFPLAAPYHAAGFAMVGIDLPYHGDRSSTPGKNGSDVEMADFSDPAKSRDNFRQAAADHIAVITGVAALNEALKPLSGMDKSLDPDKVFYVGHSMGSISGTISSGSAHKLLSVSLVGGGAPYKQLVAEGVFSVPVADLLRDRAPWESELLLTFAQTMLDAGDPINYPRKHEAISRPAKDVLIWEAVGDPVANNKSTDWQALQWGAQLLKPFDHEVPGMQAADAPVLNNFGFGDGVGKATRVLIQHKFSDVQGAALHMAIFELKRTHEVSAKCFAGRLKGAGCAVE
ncbi:MAG: hypothetical protein GMKNLPBB_02606 [Myxococcota bacterium]|nr:hypothetical protein [Myxococcota bacterium]